MVGSAIAGSAAIPPAGVPGFIISPDILYPPTFSFTDPVGGSDEINATFNAATDHTFVVDLIIPDPQTPPASNQTIFAYGLINAASNKLELRRRASTSDIQALLVAGNGTLGGFNQFFPSEMQYVNKKMRIGFVLKADGVQEIYINGRRWATCTGKTIPFTNANTALYFNAGYRTDADGDYGTRLRYYNSAQSRAAMEFITNVSLNELGIAHSVSASRTVLVGSGQSNMSGDESVGNKSIMPQVAAGKLKLLNVNGDLEAFTESWYDPGAKTPISRYNNQTFVGDSFEYFAGYMGRVGNDLSLITDKEVVVACAAASGTKISAEWAGARTDLNVGAGTTTNIGYMTFGLWETLRQAYALSSDVILVDDQGQGDALDGLPQADYETQKQAQIDWLRYYFPGLKIKLAGFNAYNAASGIVEADWNNIEAARLVISNDNLDVGFINLSRIVITNPDGRHYLNAEQEKVGEIIARDLATVKVEPL